MTVTFKFTVLYKYICKKKKNQSKSSTVIFQIILKKITFLKAANSDYVHQDLRN